MPGNVPEVCSAQVYQGIWGIGPAFPKLAEVTPEMRSVLARTENPLTQSGKASWRRKRSKARREFQAEETIFQREEDTQFRLPGMELGRNGLCRASNWLDHLDFILASSGSQGEPEEF